MPISIILDFLLFIDLEICIESKICDLKGLIKVDLPTKFIKELVFFNSEINLFKAIVSAFLRLNILIISSFVKFYAACLFLFFLIYLRIAIIAAGVTPEIRDAAPIVGGLT